MRTTLSLNGLWEVSPGNKDAPNEHWKRRVPVPGVVDLAQPGYDWENIDFHWYRFMISPHSLKRGQSAFLKLNQSQFGTYVRLNGTPVGESISCYTSQEYRIDSLLTDTRNNELLVRAGAKHTLPPHSAVGKDQEKLSFTPGIWGDVSLVQSGNPRIKLVQVVPNIRSSTAEVRVWVENCHEDEERVTLQAEIIEAGTRRRVSSIVTKGLVVPPLETRQAVVEMKIANARHWEPADPFLYEVECSVLGRDGARDSVKTTFGMREFRIRGGDFFLNGKKILLRGGNIAFHRFLSDPDRRQLPWNPDWIKRVLIDIPKDNHFNFFRNHLGQMYNLWYDIADRHGMLIQNEWQFWGTTGSKEQIKKELTEWLQDNWNHPSIIIWDPLNESSDEVVENDIVPQLKEIDPTRPWESIDFVEEHPYIYSLGPVLHDRTFGFARSLAEIEKSEKPSVVNEFIWWWLDKDGNPTNLTQEVAERWLGASPTPDDLSGHQAFLAQELVELFRRMRVDAIQPFVYLSNSNGATGHWFLGDISELKPKPVLSALRNVFAPFGVSLELWDRHFYCGGRLQVRLFIFNDSPGAVTGSARYGVLNETGEWLSSKKAEVRVDGGSCHIQTIEVVFPDIPGRYAVKAELSPGGAVSQKIAHVFEFVQTTRVAGNCRTLVLDSTGELLDFLAARGVPAEEFGSGILSQTDLLIVSGVSLRTTAYQSRLQEITEWVRNGGMVVLVEPEFGVEEREKAAVLEDLSIDIHRRPDVDRGGYDSYLFAGDHSHPLWQGFSPEHLKMFNGGFGGEVLSQHEILPSTDPVVLARCGLGLRTAAAMEIPVHHGKVIISRLQLRGRLMHQSAGDSLYDRRPDPVIQRYLMNVVSYAGTLRRNKSTTLLHSEEPTSLE